jgi:capsular polysaccharide biosynthesis protein
MVAVADPVMAAEESIHKPVKPAVFTCHEPLAVVEVTAVVEASGRALIVTHEVPSSPLPLNEIVPVHVPVTVRVAPPLSCGSPTTRAVVFDLAGQLLALVVSTLLAAHADEAHRIVSSSKVESRFICVPP